MALPLGVTATEKLFSGRVKLNVCAPVVTVNGSLIRLKTPVAALFG